MSRRAGGFPKQYGDPIRAGLKSLPFISHSRRIELARKWDEVGPTHKIHQFLRWYTRHDRNIIRVLRAVVAVAPLILFRVGVSVKWVIMFVVLGVFLTDTLARKRESIVQARWMEEAYDVHKQMRSAEYETDPTIQ